MKIFTAVCLFLSSLAIGQTYDINLKGSIVDNAGSPVPGAALRLMVARRTATADAEGMFEITRVATSAIGSGGQSVASRPALSGNLLYPNVQRQTVLSVTAVDMTGKKVKDLVPETEVSGSSGPLSLDFSSLDQGVYFLIVKTGETETVLKAVNSGSLFSSAAPLFKASKAMGVDTLRVVAPGFISQYVNLTALIDTAMTVTMRPFVDIAIMPTFMPWGIWNSGDTLPSTFTFGDCSDIGWPSPGAPCAQISWHSDSTEIGWIGGSFLSNNGSGWTVQVPLANGATKMTWKARGALGGETLKIGSDYVSETVNVLADTFTVYEAAIFTSEYSPVTSPAYWAMDVPGGDVTVYITDLMYTN